MPLIKWRPLYHDPDVLSECMFYFHIHSLQSASTTIAECKGLDRNGHCERRQQHHRSCSDQGDFICSHQSHPGCCWRCPERYSHHRSRLSSVMTSLPQSQLTSLSPIPPQVTSRNQLHKAISAAMSIMPQTAVKLKLGMIRHYLRISISYMNMCIWEMVISAGTQRQAFSHSCCYKPCQLFRSISLQG